MSERFDFVSGIWTPGDDTFEVTVSGYVRGTPEVKTSRAGKRYTQLTVRVKDEKAGADGLVDPKAGAYYTVRCFGRTGEQAEWLEDGERVLVTGGLDRREKNEPGQYWLSIMARAIGRDLNQPQARQERNSQSYNAQEADDDDSPF